MYGADVSGAHPDSRWQNEPGSTKANRFRVGAVADVVGRTALVTGGTRGIGAAIAKALRDADYAVAATYHGNDEAAEGFEAATGIPVFKWDVADDEACAAGVAQIAATL